VFWLIVALLIILDQAVKFFVMASMELGHSVPVLPGIFHITYIQNPGAAFGILAEQRWIFIIAGVLIIGAGVFFFKRLEKESAWIYYGSSLLLGGAASNLIDRIWLGKVIDFFDFRVWPVFNTADIAICVGVGAILYAMLMDEWKEAHQA
jgi:signal peptidase II